MNGTCETCGNDYDNCIEITYEGKKHTFDCFECAIDALAPRCASCGCRIVGHGVQAGAIYCGASCARKSGNTELQDRAEPLGAAR